GGPGPVPDRGRAVEVLPGALARGDGAVGGHVHRLVEVEVLPLGRVRRAVADLRQPVRIGDQLLARRTLGAQAPPGDGAVGVALDLNDLLVLHVDALAAADRAVRTDRAHDPVCTRRP